MKNRIISGYPIILALYPLLYLYSRNANEVELDDLIGALGAVALIAVIIWWSLGKVFNNRNKANIYTSILLFSTFTFGQVINNLHITTFVLNSTQTLRNAGIMLDDNSVDLFCLILWIGMLILTFRAMYRSKKDLKKTGDFLSVLTLIVMIMLSYNWIALLNTKPKGKDIFINEWPEEMISTTPLISFPGDSSNQPDVYYIILDGLARSDTLRDIYQYDASWFLSSLEKKGFFIADSSTSNYAYTTSSLASSLNMDYLNFLPEKFGTNERDSKPLEVMIENNRVFHIYRNLGYRIVTFADVNQPTNVVSADIYITQEEDFFHGFQDEVINLTPLPLIGRLLSLQDSYDQHRKYLLSLFEDLSKCPDIPGPIFVFSHIYAPHPPFVFDSQGGAVQPDRNFSLTDGMIFLHVASREEYLRGYREQTEFVLKKTEATIEEILENSVRPPIIIIQADHGPRSFDGWNQKNPESIQERYPIFNAYYFPDLDYSVLYEEITPVNSFRMIFKKYFGKDYSTLPDHNFYTVLERPYDYQDVTSDVLKSIEN
jgi:hypothetical protein